MLIIYDGACPFCRAYVRLLRLREQTAAVELLNARDADARIAHYQQQGYDLMQCICWQHAARVLVGSIAVTSGFFLRVLGQDLCIPCSERVVGSRC